jgi:phosphonate transport system substrate-binding protein
MANQIASGEVDALIEGVMPTLIIEQRTQRITPDLVVWRKGQRQYHSVFFVRHDSPVTHLQELRGRTIVFEAPRSTSAYHVPRATLRSEGLTLVADEATESGPEAVRYLFAGSELNQAYWVHRGIAEAGAFNDGDWERVPDTIRKDLRIIHSTRPLLRWLIAFASDLDPGVRAAVSEALTAAHQDEVGRAALQAASGIARFEHLSDADRADLAYWRTVLGELE